MQKHQFWTKTTGMGLLNIHNLYSTVHQTWFGCASVCGKETDTHPAAEKKRVFKCKTKLHFPVFLFKWVVPLTVHMLRPEADVKRMLLKMRLLLCPAKTCVRIWASCCGRSLVSSYLRCDFFLPRCAQPVLRPNERLYISALQCVQSCDDMVCTVLDSSFSLWSSCDRPALRKTSV